MKRLFSIYTLAALLLALPGLSQTRPPYKNPQLPVAERVKDLLARMTPGEKFWQLFMIPGDLDHAPDSQYLHGIFGFQVSAGPENGDAAAQLLHYGMSENATALARKINAIQRYFVERSRLGIPIIAFDEALHGLVRDRATAYPQAIALAATWDTALVGRVAAQIAREAKMRGIRQILTPVINIAGDPRWGRTEESYGEDPFLTSEIAVAFVGAFEKRGIITTPKHFVANYGDGGRDSYPIHFDERLLEEIYLAPFKAAIQKGGARSVMTAYNSLDGSPCTANDWLLNKKLKGQWGFSGFVISDAGATGGANVLHYTAKDYPSSGAQSITNGLDVIFQTAYDHYKLFIPPFLDGTIPQERIDDAVSRVLKAKFELGLFEKPYVDTTELAKWAADKTPKALAKQAALESIVLLKNDTIEKRNTPHDRRIPVLPISPGAAVSSIAVIGTDAVEARLGGYSGPGNGKISILDGIRSEAQRATDNGKPVKVSYAPGCGRRSVEWTVVPSKYLQSTREGKQVAGLAGEYFNNVSLAGQPALVRTDAALNFGWTLFSPDPSINNDFYSARWTGTLRSPVNGRFKIGLDGNDGYRLYIDDELVVDRWLKQTYSTRLTDFDFEKDRPYNIRVEFFEPSGNAHIRLIWNVGVENDWATRIHEAVATAAHSSVAIIVTGIQEGEFQDRAMLNLPGHQEELIRQVAATGTPTVVVLTGGSAITMSSWLDKIPAVIAVWYPGEEGGAAVADVLFGHYNPAGRLPITYPVSEAQLPLVYNHKPTGRGDDYNNLSGLPLFPFGFGLSYTRFEYGNLRFTKNNISKEDSTTVHFTIKNTGRLEGEEVVQLYIRDLLSTVARPVMELKGFQRVRLTPGETKELSFALTPELLSMLDKDLKTVVEPGDFRIMIGSSSRDLRLKGTLTVR
ncbi:MAG: glycoside hydrolase family 3 N-terminal domain-containing protein [Puia sp.]|nr:glycoside hydrolase family 3 N-terminal domain-containing protein [Puia sp.]